MALASTILDRAAKVLQDTTNVRWPTAELIDWINDGQREIILHRPDSNPQAYLHTMAAGTKQSIAGISPTPAKLLDVVCNATGTTIANAVRVSAVRLVQREVLDAQQINWHASSTSSSIKHYTFDPRSPLDFYVYPPLAAGTSKVHVLYSAYPTDVASGASALSVVDIYLNALLDYVLYRAYSKDSEYAGNPQRAQFHFQNFANSMGLELRGTMKMGPTASGSVWNPNSPKLNNTPSQNQAAPTKE